MPCQSYKELPYYLSPSDRENASVEVSSRIAEMRKRILEKPNTPSSSILSMELLDHGADARTTFGVARRDPQAPAPAPANVGGAADKAVLVAGAASSPSPPKVLALGPGLAAGNASAGWPHAAESASTQPEPPAQSILAAGAASDGSAEAKIREYEDAMKQVGSTEPSPAPGGGGGSGGKQKKKKK
jgi:hypothetical protein